MPHWERVTDGGCRIGRLGKEQSPWPGKMDRSEHSGGDRAWSSPSQLGEDGGDEVLFLWPYFLWEA